MPPLFLKPGSVKFGFEPSEPLVLPELPPSFEITGTFEPADYQSAKGLCELAGIDPPKLH